MITHKNIGSLMYAVDCWFQFNETDRHISYLPLAHVMERTGYLISMAKRMSIFIYSGDILKLKEDLQIGQPTFFISAPRLYNKFYDVMMKNINEQSWLLKSIAKHAIKVKVNNLRADGDLTHCFYDRLVFKKMREALGGRVRLLISGSAPMNPDVQQFFKIAMSAPFLDAYGQTEITAVSFCTLPDDNFTGHVGGPIHTIEFKLVDVPEMNYTCNDVDEFGQSSPRGEIWTRGPGVIPGYYLNEEKNKEAFTPDGWLVSGDIGQLIGPEKRLKIIDRKKNIFKL